MLFFSTNCKMIFNKEGNKYNFILVTNDNGIESSFSILAIDKKTMLCSSINNLNLILNELNINCQDYKYADSSWNLPSGVVNRLFEESRQLFLDNEFIKFLEDFLDLDREEGEWENVYNQNNFYHMIGNVK